MMSPSIIKIVKLIHMLTNNDKALINHNTPFGVPRT